MRIDLKEAIRRLQSGEVIAIPTETVYGLAAPLTNVDAIKEIFTLKKRPLKNPLITHTLSLSGLTNTFPMHTEELIDTFWPGPLTLVLPQTNVPSLVRADLPTAAFRMPDHPLTLALLKEVGPLVAPSANLSGRPTATRPGHVEADFGKQFPILDGGPCKLGLESTILGYHKDKWHLYRSGSLPPAVFAPILSYIPEPFTAEKPLSPGQCFPHYAPKAKLTFGPSIPDSPTIIGFTGRTYKGAEKVFYLGPLSDPQEIAHNLFDTLRKLDDENIPHAWIDPDFPKEGLLATIFSRLQKAAH